MSVPTPGRSSTQYAPTTSATSSSLEGPVGVETAATLGSLDVDIDVSLLTSGDRPLADFPERAGRMAERELGRRDVDVRTETRATEATENGVVLDGERVERSDLTIWAGGVKPNPVIEGFDLLRNKRGLLVDASLRCRGVDDVYAVGDVVDYPRQSHRRVLGGAGSQTSREERSPRAPGTATERVRRAVASENRLPRSDYGPVRGRRDRPLWGGAGDSASHRRQGLPVLLELRVLTVSDALGRPRRDDCASGGCRMAKIIGCGDHWTYRRTRAIPDSR